MEKDYEKYNSERVRWKTVLETVRELAPSDIILTSFEQDGDDEMAVEGELSSEVQNSIIIVEYAQSLKNRDIFSQVAFEIITKERQGGEDSEMEEIITFILLLEVKPGGG